MKFGKKPARPDSVKLKFSEIADPAKLPKPPPFFGHYKTVEDWGVLGNESVGDCVWAGAAHEHMMWIASAAQNTVQFSDSDVLSDYARVTGYVPGEDYTDNGTDMQVAASYRRLTGVRDASGGRHKISAYMALRPGNWDDLVLASWLFGAVGVGFEVPSSAEQQFEAGTPWSVVAGDSIEGGHYVPVVGISPGGNAVVVTWGRTHEMTREFYEKYNDESIAYVCLEYLNQQKLTPEGFDLEALGQFLRSIGK